MSRTAALLGTGLIGSVAARQLLEAGRSVRLWNRTAAKAKALRGRDAEVARTPAEAVLGVDAVLLFLLDEAAVAEVLDAGALDGLEHGALVVDLATTSPRAAEQFAARVREAGGRPAVAPFFGSVPEAERGELYALVGCDEGDLADVQETLAPLASRLHHAGTPAETAALKLALNVLVFPMVELIAESLALAEAQGIDPERVLAVLAEGTGVRSPIYSGRGRLMLDGDFAPRATVELATKDLALIEAAASEAGVDLPLLRRTRELFDVASEAGLAGEDMAAVSKLLPAGAARA
jgi:3-hydroxyisobutyrate dehydrogenase-like beta-hydroxyacid dehydrogenase